MKQGFAVVLSVVCVLGIAMASGDHFDSTVNLYSSINSSYAVSKLPVKTQFIPIIRKGDWVKVGVRPSGAIGWINIKQYNKAMWENSMPNLQTVSVSIDHDKNGKPSVNIIAYRNGKQLGSAQAKKLYASIQKQQAMETKYMQQVQQDMLGDMQNEFQVMDAAWNWPRN